MRELISLFNEELKNHQSDNKKQIAKFIKKLESFVHAPTNAKEIERLRPFAEDKELVIFVVAVLEKYYLQKDKLYFDRLSGEFSDYDVIGFWYSFCVLLLSNDVEGRKFVRMLVDDFISMKHPDFSILRRLFLYIEDNTIDAIKEDIFKNYNQIQKDSYINKWAESIGVVLPLDRLWQFYFDIKTENHDLSLLVEANNPDGVGLGWRIRLYKEREAIIDVRRPEKINIKSKKLETEVTPLKLKELLHELEDLFSVKFIWKTDKSYFSCGIKNKSKIDKWLMSK